MAAAGEEERKAVVGGDEEKAKPESLPLYTDERKGVIGDESKPKPVCADGELAAIEDGSMRVERKAIEERLAARYTIPAEVFSAGSASDCVLVFNLSGFRAAVHCGAPMYIMPYITPDHAVSMEAHLNERLRRLVVNPDLLASKVSAKKAMEAQSDKARPLQAPEAENKESREEHREKMEVYSLALDLVTFRRNMQKRLLFVYAAQGNWLKARSYLDQLYPNSMYMDKPQVYLEQTIRSLKMMCPYPEEHDVRGVSSDLLCILALEHWNEELLRAQGRPAAERIHVYEKLRTEYSLIGASGTASALATMKKVYAGIISFGVAQGRLAEGVVWCRETKIALVELEKNGHNLIYDLFTKIDDFPIKFDEMVATMQPLIQIATRAGAEGLRVKSEDFVECCWLKDETECRKLLVRIEGEFCNVTRPLNMISEMQDVIRAVERMIQSASGSVAVV